MRTAPPVRVNVVRQGAWPALIAALHGATAAVFVLWAGLHTSAGAWSIAALTVAAATVATAFAWRWLPHDAGELAWDGRDWSFAGQPGRLQVGIDLGRWLLLRFDATHARRRAWLALDPRMAGAAWHGLRAAVYCRGRDDADKER